MTDTKCRCGHAEPHVIAGDGKQYCTVLGCLCCAPAAKEPTTVLCIDDTPYNMRAAKEPGVRRYMLEWLEHDSAEYSAGYVVQGNDDLSESITVVLARDYDALQARNEWIEALNKALNESNVSLLQKNKKLNADWADIFIQLGDTQAGYHLAEQDVMRLTAENAAMRELLSLVHAQFDQIDALLASKAGERP